MNEGDGVPEQGDDQPWQYMIDRFYNDDRWRWNVMVDYQFVVADRYQTRIAFNVDNLLDDEEHIAFLFAPGRSMKLSVRRWSIRANRHSD